jgi:hypothetical protein
MDLTLKKFKSGSAPSRHIVSDSYAHAKGVILSFPQPRLHQHINHHAIAGRPRAIRMAPPTAAAGGLVLWLHGSAETGEQSRAQVAPYFSAVPELRLSFPTAPTTPIACYGTRG